MSQDVCVNSFFPGTARLWNSLPIECFHLTYDLSVFKSRINRHLLTVGSFYTDVLYVLCFMFYFVLLFLVTPCLVAVKYVKAQSEIYQIFSELIFFLIFKLKYLCCGLQNKIIKKNHLQINKNSHV